MRGISRLALLIVLGLAGCTSVPKKSGPPASVPNRKPSNEPFWADPTNSPKNAPAASIGGTNSSDPFAQPGNDPELTGILAGRLVDGSGRPVSSAAIQVVAAGSGGNAAPQEVELDPANKGHFYIRGLQPGRTYRLIARSRLDGRMLAGEVQARPPETRLLIPLSEELAGATTPPLPAAPAMPPGRGTGTSLVRPAPLPGPTAELGAPRGGTSEFAPAATPSTGGVEPQSYSVPAVTPSPTVPSCLVSAGRLQYMSLRDPDGQVWDFSQHRGKLVLLDFWGTWCGPCLRSIPELIRLQSTHRDRGLEVIGIACERGSSAENARRVRDKSRQIAGLNYRLVLADEEGRCPVRAQFRIESYPTLVLLDGDGTILWRGGSGQAADLDRVIRERLR
ncbi:MAG: thioredoxin-like domain-containing protein [Gemmataceae bacterium]